MDVILQVAAGMWQTTLEMAPFLLLGFLAAGILSVLISPETVERHLGGRGVIPVVKAAALGVPLPLCSCSVIPVSASLRKHGASRGATLAFLISTPQTGVDSILVTWSLLGPVVGILRPLAALLTGVIGGWIADAFDGKAAVAEAHVHGERGNGGGQTSEARPGVRHPVLQALRYGFVELPGDIAPALAVGVLLAGLISALVPEGMLSGGMGQGLPGMLFMMVLGIPMYVCATASVPIAAALVAKGVSVGAAMVFLITGPATNAATIMMVWRVLGRSMALIYLGVVALGALTFGVLLSLLDTQFDGVSVPCHSEGSAPWKGIELWSAVILGTILGFRLLPRRGRRRSSRSARDSARVGIQVDGMTCEHCVQTVRRAVSTVPGVEGVEVDLREGLIQVDGKNVDMTRVIGAVHQAGYRVVPPRRNTSP